MLGLFAVLGAVGLVLGIGFLQVGSSFGLLLSQAALPWFFLLNMVPVMIWLERKGSAWIQDRSGPERAFIPVLGLRVGGMVHNLTDVFKLLTKEEVIPRHVNRFLYVLAPTISITVALLIGAVIPFGHEVEIAGETIFRPWALDIDIGLLWLLGAGSMAVYSVVLAGWSSNNKFSQLGGLRASASMISYEVTLGLALVTAFLVYGEVKLPEIVESQAGTFLGAIPRWGIFMMPVGFVLYLISAFAETNRTPFDLVEAESEIVAGFHTEYGGLKFALFFMGEYIAIVVQSMLMATLFLGGWQLAPGFDTHTWLRDPHHASIALKGLVGVIAVASFIVGAMLLNWQRKNYRRWKDSRRHEGTILAILFGFGPCLSALTFLTFFGLDGQVGDATAAWITFALQFGALATKTLLLCWFFVWVRWTLPRFRYDQLMALGWKSLIPLAILNVLISAVLVKLEIF